MLFFHKTDFFFNRNQEKLKNFDTFVRNGLRKFEGDGFKNYRVKN